MQPHNDLKRQGNISIQLSVSTIFLLTCLDPTDVATVLFWHGKLDSRRCRVTDEKGITSNTDKNTVITQL